MTRMFWRLPCNDLPDLLRVGFGSVFLQALPARRTSPQVPGWRWHAHRKKQSELPALPRQYSPTRGNPMTKYAKVATLAAALAVLITAYPKTAPASGTVCPDGNWSPTGFCPIDIIPGFLPCGPTVDLQPGGRSAWKEGCCPPEAMCIDVLPPCPIISTIDTAPMFKAVRQDRSANVHMSIPETVFRAMTGAGFPVPSWTDAEPTGMNMSDAAIACLNSGECLLSGYCKKSLSQKRPQTKISPSDFFFECVLTRNTKSKIITNKITRTAP